MRVYRQLAVFGCLVFLPTGRVHPGVHRRVRQGQLWGDPSGRRRRSVSPALIEKVRSVASDGTGQYKIVDLRPGVYSVTFTLPGFQTVKREGIELAGSFAATVNADLTIGSVAETLIVTGEAPTVDVQNTKRSAVISADVISELPAARSQYNLAVLAARRDADELHGQQHPGRRRHAQHGHHHLLGPRQPGRRSAPDDQRPDRAQSAGVGVGEQFRARHGHRGRGDARLLVRLGRGGGRRPGHQPDSRRKAAMPSTARCSPPAPTARSRPTTTPTSSRTRA